MHQARHLGRDIDHLAIGEASTPSGSSPTFTALIFFPVATSMKPSSPSSSLLTYSVLPSGDRSNASGSSPSGSLPVDLRVATSMMSAWCESPQAVISFLPSGVSRRWRGRLQVGTVPITLSLSMSIRVSALSFSLETQATPGLAQRRGAARREEQADDERARGRAGGGKGAWESLLNL